MWDTFFEEWIIIAFKTYNWFLNSYDINIDFDLGVVT